jgi:predicted metal-dependent peptidase
MTVGERIKHLSQDWFLTEPLLFAVLCTHALKRNDNMGCDMRCGKGLIEYNPERLEHLDDNQLALRLKAEVVRIILKHPYQRQPYNPRRDLMRLSSDLTLSDNLEGMDTIGLEPPHIFDIQRGQAFEQYYSLMADQVIKLELDADGDGITLAMPGDGDSKGDGDESGDSSSGGEFTDAMLDADAGASLWEEDELMSEKVNHEIETAQRCNQWGSIGGDLKALIESTLVSKQNFRAILSQFRASILSTKRHLTRMRPNRRYGFDAMGSQYAYSTRLLVAVDVSGSVPDEDIRKFLAVINRFFKQGIESIEVIEFDSKITTEKPLLLKQAANGIRVIGRGGTNFQPAIDFYYEHEEYDGLVFLTDGYAATPKLPDDKRHKPIAWILTQNGGNEDNLKPLGPVVRITGL